MIRRRVEYVRYCDNEFCDTPTDVDAEWTTRELAEAAAVRDGWVRLTRGRWMCPKCKERKECYDH